jgi:hypothetical protein
MATYKTSRAINDPRNKNFIPKDSEISKEDFNFFHSYKEQETDKIYPLRETIYVINTGEQIIRSAQELIADILDSASYLTKELLAETITKLQETLSTLSDPITETKPEEPTTETKPEIKAKK